MINLNLNWCDNIQNDHWITIHHLSLSQPRIMCIGWEKLSTAIFDQTKHFIWPIRTHYTFVSTNEQFAPNEDDLAMVQQPSTITILYIWSLRIGQLMGVEYKFDLMLSTDGSGRGAALVAAVLKNQEENWRIIVDVDESPECWGIQMFFSRQAQLQQCDGKSFENLHFLIL